MKDFFEIDINTYNRLDTDYKAEVVAYNILKYHKQVNEVFVKRLGDNDRSFNKDVKDIVEEYFDLNERVVTIRTYREGLYDYLPEGVFHPPTLRAKGHTINEIIDQIRIQKKSEESARKFFQPFEMEFYYSNLSALFMESDFDMLGENNYFLEIISELWPLLKELDYRSAQIFAHLLPYFNATRGKKEWLEKCLSSFLEIPVNIEFVPNKIEELDQSSEGLVLSNIKLGLTSVLTGVHFDGERNWAINYGPISYEQLDKYMPTTHLRKLLNMIYDYCLPAPVKVVEYFFVDKNEESFQLNNTSNNSLLGYSTYL